MTERITSGKPESTLFKKIVFTKNFKRNKRKKKKEKW